MSRLIDADRLKSYIDAQKGRPFIGCTIGEALKIMTDEQSTIDAVEVVRCKDCKHYYFAENRVPEEQSWVCDVWHVNQTAHMGYCFKAERRNNETD